MILASWTPKFTSFSVSQYNICTYFFLCLVRQCFQNTISSFKTNELQYRKSPITQHENSDSSSHCVSVKASLVLRRLRRFLLSTWPSLVLTSYDVGPTSSRTVAFRFHASWSWMHTTSSLASGLRVLVDLSYRCFCFHFIISSFVCISAFSLMSE